MQTASRVSLTTFTTLELLDRAFRIYRDHFLTFLIPTAIVNIPLIVVNIFTTLWSEPYLLSYERSMQRFAISPSNTVLLSAALGDMLTFLLVTVALAVFGGIVQGIFIHTPLTYLTSELHMGRKPAIGEVYRVSRSRMPAVGMGLTAYYLLLMALGFVLGVIYFACGLGFGLIAYVSVVFYGFLVPVLVLERTSIGLGLRRGWSLAKARFWAILGIMFTVWLISFVFSIGLNTLEQLLTQNVIASASVSVADIVSQVVQALITMFLTPILPIALTLMYYDTRIRAEGLDIALSLSQRTDARPSDVISPPPTRGLLTNKDFGNLVLLTGGIFAVLLLIVFVAQLLS
jgi:hypothetical protein